MQLIPPSVQDAPTGTVFEVSLASTAIMRNLARHLASYGGAGLFIDYGYGEYHGKPTLQALKNHQFTDVLQSPGESDITAHVDFGMLRLVAEGQGVHVAPLVGQGKFLTNLGIGLRAMQLKHKASTAQVEQIDSALHRLTDASQMGQLFKVLVVSSPAIEDLPGF
jgi:SAM-dependent MidA family methyltransferase